MCNQSNNNDTGVGGMRFVSPFIPLDPEDDFFNCKMTNQNALRGETFWVIKHCRKKMEHDGRESEKYIVMGKRNLTDPNELAFKFFTGSKKIKFKLDFITSSDEYDFPAHVKLVGEANNFDIEVMETASRG
jgi:hypothetical protein